MSCTDAAQHARVRPGVEKSVAGAQRDETAGLQLRCLKAKLQSSVLGPRCEAGWLRVDCVGSECGGVSWH